MARCGPFEAAYPSAPQGELDRAALLFQFQHTPVCELLIGARRMGYGHK